MDVQLADGVTIVRIDHPPVNARDLPICDGPVGDPCGAVRRQHRRADRRRARVDRRSAVELARSLGRHPATAYAAMKQQLHRHARAAIDAGEELDAKVRAVWKSAETRGAISAFLDALN
jgi:hypothetical protein